MKLKKILPLLAMAILMASCNKPAGELIGAGNASNFKEANPYGMLFIKKGSYMMGANTQSAVFEQPDNIMMATVESFWMDEKEVSNAMYRQFVQYVRDSIIRERLADPSFGDNEDFKITMDKHGEEVTPHLNWSKPIPWRRPNEAEQSAIESVFTTDPITGKKMLDAKQMNYRYETFDYKSYAQRRYRMDPETRDLNTDHAVDYDKEILISKDTAYVDEDGNIQRSTIVRPLTSAWDFVNTYIVNIYPDTTVWVNDFANAFTDQYARYYFSSPIYDDYPVVGVSWEQATAYCAWRTEFLKQS